MFKFNIDKYVKKVIKEVELDLPLVLKRFLGKHPVRPVSDYWIWLEILISSFCGIALLEGVFKSHTVFSSHHAPIVIASYGATAILCFNTNQAPLAQPRNIFWGHFVSSLVGLCISKLFGLSAAGRSAYWASGALSVGVASVLMTLLNCTHPPAGASALLPSIDAEIRSMSWWYLPVQIISSILIICVAMITGNIIRKYPAYWFYPSEPKVISNKNDIENKPMSKRVITISDSKIDFPSDFHIPEDEYLILQKLQKKLDE